ncbi:TolC family outer membrane protein [Marinomonas mediterranea]|jgi:type I secretion outer membrane protein, TolC family|uniref:Type I secretion outer membrane protein, TolC family n=1 Tax=Marinomonas mediterranea (strain ATCC 700492 / JCM 21426 / NBRC 103028 / MMB-1) TaxID=717774 RepID=F2JZE1_MARM1|nr:TolC family outer membrane protein [Marinomonas mediterranea]ADZ93226.1 type I secretion outer membrane protein, TolC family [Marinomonas mediterranea MMB-1]WCN11115.1 TolC family outer membrane protein [Marinomonas mediterranea]WCN15178.1 TolC family outer membrane protein [Marinomonas mediterranea]WCN19222.1 TolC family outer membrane protein [Marinomonas mediterranea MMB-1]
MLLKRLLLSSACTITLASLSANASAISLEEATYIAIENSPEVRQAVSSYREGLTNTEITRRGGLYPRIDLSAGIGHETTYDFQQSGEDVDLTRRELSLSLTQPIYDGSLSKNETKRLSEETEASRWQALSAVENTALEVAEAYANVLRFRELVDLADLNLETHTRIFKQIRLKSNAGVGRQSDLSQITARLAKAKSNRLSAVNNLRNAESQYKKVVGELPQEEMIYPVPDREQLPKDLDDALDQAMTKNPAIEGAYWDVKATDSFISATKADNLPTINFELARTFNNNLDGNENPSEDLTAMFRLTYNLYSGGLTKRRTQVANEQNTQAREVQRRTQRETELTVRQSWAAYEATLEQKEHIREYVIATKESQIAYEKQFRLGRRTLLDVLDSENELFQARQDYVNTDYDELFSEFRLFNAKGDLMRAFRIYRPPVLGFEDEFVDDEPPTGQTAIEELQNAETQIAPAEPTTAPDVVTTPDVTPTNTQPESSDSTSEDELFLDSGEEGGNW